MLHSFKLKDICSMKLTNNNRPYKDWGDQFEAIGPVMKGKLECQENQMKR
jgi:hypothetical protein